MQIEPKKSIKEHARNRFVYMFVGRGLYLLWIRGPFHITIGTNDKSTYNKMGASRWVSVSIYCVLTI